MSAAPQEAPDVSRGFDEAAIDDIFRASEAPWPAFRDDVRPLLTAHSIALQALHGRLLVARIPELAIASQTSPVSSESDQAAREQTTGYLLAFQVLRLAAPFKPAPVDEALAAQYGDRYIGSPRQLETDFYRDYRKHPSILSLVDTRLRSPPARYGAEVMFAVFGGQANPNRPAIRLTRASQPSKPDDSAPIPDASVQQRKSEKRHVRTLTGDHRF